MRFSQPKHGLRPVPERFAADLVAHWAEHGRATIDQLRAWTPHRYVQLVGSLVLAQPTSDAERHAAMSEEELMKAYHDVIAHQAAEGFLPPFLRYVPLGDD